MARSGQGYLGLLRRRRGLTDQELADLPGSSVQPALGYYPGVTGGPLGILDRPQAPFGLSPIQTPGMPSWAPTARPVAPTAGPYASLLAKPLPPALAMPQRQAPALAGPQAPDTMGGLLNAGPDYMPQGVSPGLPDYMQQPNVGEQTPLEDPFASQQPRDMGEMPPVEVKDKPYNAWEGMSQFPAYQPPNMPSEQAQAPQTHVNQQDGFGSPTALALLSAGLGILANNTGHYGQAGPAIGKGGMIGLNTFMQLKQQQIANEQAKAKMAMQEDQHKAYMQQVAQQQRKLDIQDQQDTRLQAAMREYMSLPDNDPRKKQVLNLITMYQGKANELIKEQIAANKPERAQFVELGVGQNDKGEDMKQKFRVTPQGLIPEKEPYVSRGISINNLPENKAQTVLAGKAAESVEARRNEAVHARQGANEFKLLADMLAEYQGGTFDQLMANVGRVMPIEGLKDIATADQLAKSIQLRASNAFRMPGSVSNYEQQTYLAAVPSLLWYRDGRHAAADMADKLATRKSKLVTFETKMLREDGYIDQEKLDEYDKSLGAIFTDEDKQKLRGAVKNAMPKQDKPAAVMPSNSRKKKEPSIIPNTDPRKGPVAPPGYIYEEQ